MDHVDFLPERVKAQRARRRRIVCQAYLLVACVGVMVLLGYVRQGWIDSARAELSVLDERVANMHQQLDLRSDLERQQAELKIMKRIEAALGSRINVLDVLAELERVMPTGIALANLDMETMEIRVPVESIHTARRPRVAMGRTKKSGEIIKRIRLVLTGLSPTDVDVANFIGQLSASPLFEDVNMGYARNVECRGRQAREFQASCLIVR